MPVPGGEATSRMPDSGLPLTDPPELSPGGSVGPFDLCGEAGTGSGSPPPALLGGRLRHFRCGPVDFSSMLSPLFATQGNSPSSHGNSIRFHEPDAAMAGLGIAAPSALRRRRRDHRRGRGRAGHGCAARERVNGQFRIRLCVVGVVRVVGDRRQRGPCQGGGEKSVPEKRLDGLGDIVL